MNTLVFLLGLFLLSSVSYGQDTIAVTTSDINACPGDAVTVMVDATNINSVGAISLVLEMYCSKSSWII